MSATATATAIFRSSFASSSRITLHHLPPAALLPLQRSQRYNSSLSPLPVRTPEPASAGFEGIAPAYNGPVKTKTAPPASASPSAKAKAGTAGKRKVEIKAKKNAISITPAAISHLQTLLASSSEPKLLRIGVKSRGCAGMAYHLEYVPPPGGRFDEVVEQDGVRVLIDSKALFSIIGSKMDWRDTRLSAGFVFDNPNVVDTCGCGESFNIRI